MIITIKKRADEKQLDNLIAWLNRSGVSAETETFGDRLAIAVFGDVSLIDEELLRDMDIVESVTRVSEKYKLTNRKLHPENTIVEVGGKKFGGNNYSFIAGPCSVESEKQIIGIAKAVKAAGATLLRGGAFKPRTSPYDFQGLKSEGIKLLKKAKAETGLPIVTEITSVKSVDDFEGVDLIQVGARNMQNFELLKEVGKLGAPVLLKRGLVNTVDELLLSAEYVMSEGNKNVILCERGIRTFETLTRNTLDLGVIPLLKERTHLPVIVDPSHASGLKRLVEPLSLAAAAVGADGTLTVIRDLRMKEPYVGTIDLVSGEIAEDITSYFAQSEQIPTACALGVLVGKDQSVTAAGGYIIQLLPGAPDDIIDKIEAGIQNAGAVSRLLAAGMDGQVVLETVLHGFDLEILETQPVEYRCYCSRDRVTRTLISLGRKELQSIVDDGKDIHIDCQFCDKIYDYTPEQVRQILKELDE